MRILLIEDDPQLSEALASFLRAKGFVVDTAGTLAQARATLPAAHWGAVLLDLHLPDGDGLSLLPLLQRKHPDSGAIVLTAPDRSPTASGAWTPGPTTTWSNPSTPRNCWPGCVRWSAAGAAPAARAPRSPWGP